MRVAALLLLHAAEQSQHSGRASQSTRASPVSDASEDQIMQQVQTNKLEGTYASQQVFY